MHGITSQRQQYSQSVDPCFAYTGSCHYCPDCCWTAWMLGHGNLWLCYVKILNVGQTYSYFQNYTTEYLGLQVARDHFNFYIFIFSVIDIQRHNKYMLFNSVTKINKQNITLLLLFTFLFCVILIVDRFHTFIGHEGP